MLQTLLDLALSAKGLATIVSLGGALLALVVGTQAVRRRRVALAVFHAFSIVEDIDAERGDAKLDKALEGLRQADAWMVANGWRPLKPREQSLARLGFSAIHGEQKAALKVAASVAPSSPQ